MGLPLPPRSRLTSAARWPRRAALRATLALSLGAVALPSTPATAGAPPAGAPRTLSLPATQQQHALAIELSGGELRARACPARQRCTATGAAPLAIDPDAHARLGDATLERIDLGRGRQLVAVNVPGSSVGERWIALLGASGPREPAEVTKPLSGWLGRPQGSSADRRVSVLLREPTPHGERLVTGYQYESVSLCGRPALSQARVLDPVTMEWSWTSVQSLSSDERAKAPTLVAVPSDERASAQAPRLLRARGGSSSPKTAASALTDGDLATSWSEQRPGRGVGEFVTFGAATSVPILGLELVLRPTANEPAAGAAPERLWLAAPGELLRIDLPAGAWQSPPGTSFRVGLPKPLRTDCLAIVLDQAQTGGREADVTVTEVRARTELDDAADWAAVLRAMSAGGDRARMASGLLKAGGREAMAALMQAYLTFDRATRQHVLELVAASPCDQSAPFLVERLWELGASPESDPTDPAGDTVRSRLRSCGEPAADALVNALRKAPANGGSAAVAAELALAAPARAVPAIVDTLASAPDDVRAQLRGSLGTALGTRRGRRALPAELAAGRFAARPLVSRIDLLRAAGSELVALPESAAAFRQVAESDRSFRTRYLLLRPAGELARHGATAAVSFLDELLRSDPSPHLRAEALRVSVDIPALATAREQALSDGSPRVREAALEALGRGKSPPGPSAQARVAALLAADPWTFVREGAAIALASPWAASEAEEALAEALDDESDLVRREAVRALGKRGEESSRARVRRVADRAKETVYVRVAAIQALAELCDHDAVELLTKLALRAGAPQLPYDQPLGVAALAALGRIHPADLAERFAPLSDPRVPPSIRQLVTVSLSAPGACRQP